MESSTDETADAAKHEGAAVPIESGAEGISPHPHPTGRRHVDFIVACLAILISLISLGVGFENARSQQQMVAASSWPFLIYDTSTSNNGQAIDLRIINQGVGPARIKSVTISYDGHSASGLRDLLSICCGLPKGASWESLDRLGLLQESTAVGVVAPRESIDLVRISRTPENSAMWDRLEQARQHLVMSACYCSVLNACWITDLKSTSDPKPVDQCKAEAGYIE
jgi:hypothetical protein